MAVIYDSPQCCTQCGAVLVRQEGDGTNPCGHKAPVRPRFSETGFLVSWVIIIGLASLLTLLLGWTR